MGPPHPSLREIPDVRYLMRPDPVSSRVENILYKGDWLSWGNSAQVVDSETGAENE